MTIVKVVFSNDKVLMGAAFTCTTRFIASGSKLLIKENKWQNYSKLVTAPAQMYKIALFINRIFTTHAITQYHGRLQLLEHMLFCTIVYLK